MDISKSDNLTDRDITILVNSCDLYEDAWEPFFRLFHIMWPDCPYDVYLNTETKVYNCSFMKVQTICGGNISWSKRLKNCLEQIKTKYVLFFIEDFFLMSPVNERVFDSAVRLIHDNKRIGFISFNPDLEKEGGFWDLTKEYNDVFNYIGKKSLYRINAQVNLWNKRFLKRILKNKESAWDFEVYGTIRAKIMPEIALSRKIDGPIVFDYHYSLGYGYGIKQGKWLLKNKELFEKYDIDVDFDKRGFYSRPTRVSRTKRNKSELLKLVYKNPKELITIIKNSMLKSFPFIKAFF